MERASYQNRLGILLEEKLNFKQHVENAIMKINKGTSVIKKLRYSLPQKSLVTIYKAFLRPQTDSGDIIYDQPQNCSFCEIRICTVESRVSNNRGHQDPLVKRSIKN